MAKANLEFQNYQEVVLEGDDEDIADIKRREMKLEVICVKMNIKNRQHLPTEKTPKSFGNHLLERYVIQANHR